LTPFILLFIMSFKQHAGHFTIPALSLKGVGFSSTGMALYTIMWNYIGWDNATTYAEEVKRPVRSYLLSTGIAFGSIFIIYLLAIYTAQGSGINFDAFNETGFPALGVLVGGHWLGALLAAGGMASCIGLFSAVLLSVSRVPKVMSDDKLLPAKLHTLHPKFNTPYISIIICALVVSLMVLWTFADLLIIDVTLYGAGLLLEFISLIVLRYKAPDEKRPFKIPLNAFGLCIMVILPLVVLGIALTACFATTTKAYIPAIFAIVALLTAEIAWWVIKIYQSRKLRTI
jgi:amino acid transporter